MTTIACDGTCIAGDGLITSNGAIHERNCQKVFRLKDGSVVGMTGSVFTFGDAIAFLDGDKDALAAGDGFEALILKPTGDVLCMDGKGRTYPQPAPCATGSGAPFALAAMKCGQSARQAVEVAAHFCTITGGTITVIYPGDAI